MRTFANHLRGRLSRALVISSASALMLGVGLPGAAHAAVTTPSVPAAYSSASNNNDSHRYECYHYDYDRDRVHYYAYCYDYIYQDRRDQKHDRRWYESYELRYWFFKNGQKHYGSCSFNYDFGYSHPDRPWKRSCTFN